MQLEAGVSFRPDYTEGKAPKNTESYSSHDATSEHIFQTPSLSGPFLSSF